MNNTPDNRIEKALAMYTETVSPSKAMLVNVLNQIPEIKELPTSDRRAIRSPYRWLAVAQLASVFLVALAVLPSITGTKQSENPFYEVDAQIERFEQGISTEDYNRMLSDYTL